MASPLQDQNPTATIEPTPVAIEEPLRQTEEGETRVFEDGDAVELE